MYKIPETSVNQKVGDELVILDLDSGKYFGLDEVGARMVELLGEHGVPAKVVDIITSEYDVPSEQVEGDLDTLIVELVKNNLIIEAA